MSVTNPISANRKLLLLLVLAFSLCFQSQALPKTKTKLLVCYNFGRDFSDYDKPILEEYITGFPCISSWLEIVLVPYEDDQCASCEHYAVQLGIKCECISDLDKSRFGLQMAPSFRLEDSDGSEILNSQSSRLSLKRLGYMQTIPRGKADILIDREFGHDRLLIIKHSSCPDIEYLVTQDTTLADMPIGYYKVHHGANFLGGFHVADGETEQFTAYAPKSLAIASRNQLPSSQITSVLHESSNVGSFLLGINGGAYLLKLDNSNKYKGLASIGLSMRINGVFGLEGGILLSDTLKQREGYLAALDLCPKFLCSSSIGLSLRVGVLNLHPRKIGPNALRNRVDYNELFYGASIIIGKTGFGDSENRSGLVFDVHYSEEKQFSGESETMILGGITFGIRVTFEGKL